MARGQLIAGKVLALSIVCLTISLATDARAAEDPDPTILLDSHVYQSDLVIEARPVHEGRHVDSKDTPAEKAADVRVTAVYRGNARIGDTITVAGLNEFCKPGAGQNTISVWWSSISVPTVPLGPKDHLILFLKKATAEGGHDHPDDRTFAPISPRDGELGARIVVRGGVYSFSQTPPLYSGSATAIAKYPPFVADVVSSVTPLGEWPVSQPFMSFRDRLNESAARANDWHSHLDRPPVAADISWLISLLKERFTRPDPSSFLNKWIRESGDAVADDVIKHIVKLGDLRAMIEAISANPDRTREFAEAFATPAGRDFLLARLKDHTLTVAHRKSLAYLVGEAGIIYTASANWSVTTQPWLGEKHVAPRNGSYITRIADAAADLSAAGDDDIAIVLLEQLEEACLPFNAPRPLLPPGVHTDLGPSRGAARAAQINLDLDDAGDVLCKWYDRKDLSEEARFCIAKVAYAISDEKYAKLKSPCRAILTYTHPVDPAEIWEPAPAPQASVNVAPGPTVTVACEYRRVDDKITAASAFLVMDSVAGGNSYVIASTIASKLDGLLGQKRFIEETLPLPPDLKPDRYRLHYRLMNGSTIVSEGHGFETVLPEPPPPGMTVTASSYMSPIIPTYQPWPRSRRIEIASAILAVPALLILRAFMRSWRQRRRARNGLCPQCAYDLRFSPDRCPECGTPVAANISRGLFRKCVARIVLTASAILLIATSAAWVRSHYVADCWVLSTPERADSLYFSRGVVVLNLLTTAGPPGWTHDRHSPAALPRSMAESGDLASRNILGIEYSSLSDMLIVPMWALAAMAAACGALMLLILRALRQPLLKNS